MWHGVARQGRIGNRPLRLRVTEVWKSLPGRYFQADGGNTRQATVAHALLYNDPPHTGLTETHQSLERYFLLHLHPYARTQPAPVGIAQGGIKGIEMLCTIGRDGSDEEPKIGIVIVVGIAQPHLHIVEGEGVGHRALYLHQRIDIPTLRVDMSIALHFVGGQTGNLLPTPATQPERV